MSFCMQPDGRSAHICGSKAAGVKTPKHPLHRCLDFSVMRYGDGRSWRESRDAPYGPMGALVWGDCGTTSFLCFLRGATCWCLPSTRQEEERKALLRKPSSHVVILELFLSSQGEGIPPFRCFPFRAGCFSFLKDKIFGLQR